MNQHEYIEKQVQETPQFLETEVEILDCVYWVVKILDRNLQIEEIVDSERGLRTQETIYRVMQETLRIAEERGMEEVREILGEKRQNLENRIIGY